MSAAQHRAARTHSRARWAVPLILALLALAYWHGTQVQAQHTAPATAPAAVQCTAEDAQTLKAEQEWRATHPDAPHNTMPCETLAA